MTQVKEIPYAQRQIDAADGRPLILSYSVLLEEREDREHFGCMVLEQRSGHSALALDLTTEPKRFYALMDQLARNTVTPVGLLDVIDDWL